MITEFWRWREYAWASPDLDWHGAKIVAAGVYPSAQFGANAAWLRLQVLTSNLLVLLKAKALDEQYRNA